MQAADARDEHRGLAHGPDHTLHSHLIGLLGLQVQVGVPGRQRGQHRRAVWGTCCTIKGCICIVLHTPHPPSEQPPFQPPTASSVNPWLRLSQPEQSWPLPVCCAPHSGTLPSECNPKGPQAIPSPGPSKQMSQLQGPSVLLGPSFLCSLHRSSAAFKLRSVGTVLTAGLLCCLAFLTGSPETMFPTALASLILLPFAPATALPTGNPTGHFSPGPGPGCC